MIPKRSRYKQYTFQMIIFNNRNKTNVKEIYTLISAAVDQIHFVWGDIVPLGGK